MADLKTLMDELPDDALVPIGWIRGRIEALPADGDDVADLSCEDVGTILKRTPSCIRGWCASGQFDGAYRLNNKEWRIPRVDLRKYLDAHGSKTKSTTAAPDLGSWRKKKLKTRRGK